MRRIGILVFSTVAIALAGLIPGPREVQGEDLCKIAVENARAKYAKARTIYTTFEGSFAPIGGERHPLSGSMAYRSPDAFRHDLVMGDRTYVTRQIGDLLQKWTEQGTTKSRFTERKETGPVEPQFPPAFESFNEESFELLKKTHEKDAPAIYVVQAKFKGSGDPFASARMGIEDGSWLIRTLDLVDHEGNEVMTLRFKEIKLGHALPAGCFE